MYVYGLIMLRSIQILVFILFCLPSAIGSSLYDSLSSRRVVEFDRGIYLAPLVKYRYPSVNLRGQDALHQSISYRPNNRYIAGFRGMAFGINFEVSKSIGQGDRVTSRFGETDASDLLVNVMTPRLFGDIQWLNYRGVYLRRSWEDYKRNDALPVRPDINILIRTVSATWILKPDAFSMRSAYSFRERQTESGGSPLLRVTLNRFLMTGDSALVGSRDITYFPDMNQVNGMVVHVLGFAPGYGYNYIWRYFFISGSAVAGPANYWIREDRISGGSTYDMRIDWIANIGLAIGYNGNRFFGGLSYRVQGFSNRIDKTRFNSNQNVIQFMAGYRFVERGLFTRRVQQSSWWPRRSWFVK